MSLPGWLDPVFDAEEMRAADRFAIEERGVPSLELMERAGEGLARATAEVADAGAARGGAHRVRVVIGKGNNGGDGLVAARILREEGRGVDVLAVQAVDDLEGDARANLERLPGAAPEPFSDGAGLAESGAVVDAILGTGFSGAPREPVAGAIARINAELAPVVACDVPSGVSASDGEVEGEAVCARLTATFHGPKLGLHVAPGAFHAGEVRIVDIGVPRDAPTPASAGLIADRVLERIPPRAREGTKFSSGVVVVAGGSAGLTGAPTMAAHAALRTGAGYVQLAVPASTEQVFALKLVEAMTAGLPEEDGAHVPAGAERVAELAERAGCVVLGPGIGKGDGAFEFARRTAQLVDAPLLVDADGLNAHAEALESLSGRPAPTVLTPHAAELGRLLGRETSEVSAHRLACAREAAERSGAIVVLKGDDSIVAAPGGPVGISPGGAPGLATAGTGDVLSGLAAALLAKGLEPFCAAAAGVLAHVRAGQVAARRLGANHTMATDVIEAIPAALGGPRRRGRRRRPEAS